MASLRGGQLLWGAVATDGTPTYVGHSVIKDDKSGWAVIGAGPYVAVYIDNQGSHNATFKIQAAANDDPRAGLNWLDTDDVDGGIVWYDYTGQTSIAVSATSQVCIDLAPFSPPLVRLVRTDNTGADNVVAIVSSFGPN